VALVRRAEAPKGFSWKCRGYNTTASVLGDVTSAGWQVTLCDPIWHVSSRSGEGCLQTAIHLTFTFTFTMGSFFAQCVLGIDKVHMMMYYWHHHIKATRDVVQRPMPSKDITCCVYSWNSMVNYHNFFRVECLTWLNTQHVELGGLDGNGSAMYVDEMYHFHRKYHCGWQ